MTLPYITKSMAERFSVKQKEELAIYTAKEAIKQYDRCTSLTEKDYKDTGIGLISQTTNEKKFVCEANGSLSNNPNLGFYSAKNIYDKLQEFITLTPEEQKIVKIWYNAETFPDTEVCEQIIRNVTIQKVYNLLRLYWIDEIIEYNSIETFPATMPEKFFFYEKYDSSDWLPTFIVWLDSKNVYFLNYVLEFDYYFKQVGRDVHLYYAIRHGENFLRLLHSSRL